MTRTAPAVFAVLVAVLNPLADAEETRRVTIRGIGVDLGETPVLVDLREPLPAGDYVLERAGDGTKLPANVVDDAGHRVLGLLLDRLKADASETLTLRRTSPAAPGVAIERKGANLVVKAAGAPLTEYVTDVGPKPFYWPVYGPGGVAMTRAYPMEDVRGETRDHPHQRSMWFTHGKVNGIDFWSEIPGHGSIKETSRKTVAGGSAFGMIRTTDDWLGPGGRKVCEDERVVRFYATRDARILDVDITVRASDGPVTFGDTKEGTFGLRVASSMDVDRKQGGRITNAEGLHDVDAWGKPSAWVDYTGPVEDRTVGIAILNHPDSVRFPTTWHVRTYGLFAANPFGWHDFGRPTRGDLDLAAGESIAFRYRVILHAGDTDSARLAEAFRAYAKAPAVEIRAD